MKIFNYRTCGEDLNCFHHHRAMLVCTSLSESVVCSFFLCSFFLKSPFFFSVVSHFVLFLFDSLFSCNFVRSFTLFFYFIHVCYLFSLFIRLFDFYVSTLFTSNATRDSYIFDIDSKLNARDNEWYSHNVDYVLMMVTKCVYILYWCLLHVCPNQSNSFIAELSDWIFLYPTNKYHTLLHSIERKLYYRYFDVKQIRFRFGIMADKRDTIVYFPVCFYFLLLFWDAVRNKIKRYIMLTR